MGVTSDDICRFFKQEAYHTDDPTEDMRPTFCRSSNLEAHKRAISHFMPRKLIPWDPISLIGNPTKSKEVNELINCIKKFECRREGVPSKARRPIEFDEFKNLLDVTRDPSVDTDDLRRCRMASVLTLQWQLIGRIDDMMKLKIDRISTNPSHAGTGNTKIEWSKNITEERDAAEQILLASNDPKLCALLALGVYVETLGRFDASHITNADPLFGDSENGDRFARTMLDKAFLSPTFRKAKAGNLGTHSIRKGASTYASRAGMSRDFVKRRGRWRARKQVVDTYIDITLPYPDAKTAAVLCGPSGPCRYKARDGVEGLSRAYYLNVVAPTVNQIMGEEMALLIAPALIWAAFDTTNSALNVMPESLRERIVNGFPGTENPIEKISLLVTGEGDQLRIIDLISQDSVPHENMVHAAGGTANIGNANNMGNMGREEAQGLYSLLYAQQRQVEESRRENNFRFDGLLTELKRMRTNIRRIAVQPVVRHVLVHPNAEDGASTTLTPGIVEIDILQDRAPCTLSKKPPDLFALWREYEFGIGGRKAAKDFSPTERGKSRFTYSRRKVFWDCVITQIQLGYTNEVAIDRIYGAYGRGKTISQILAGLRKDRANGGNALLTGSVGHV
jgi:hypothetical protein